MPIKRFITEGQAWERYQNSYKAKKSQLEQSHKTSVANMNRDINTSNQTITRLDNDIAQNKSNIQAFVTETMECDAFSSISNIVASFGFTTDKSDRTSDLVREKNNLKSNLVSKKNLEQRIISLRQSISTADKNYQQSVLTLDQAYEKERQRLIKLLTPLYNAQKARCIPKYGVGSVPPGTNSTPPSKVIMGTQRADIRSLTGVLPNTLVYTPYEVDVKNEGNFIIHIKQDDLYSEKLEQIMVGMILKYVDSFPAKKLHLGVFSSTLPSLNLLSGLYRAMKKNSCTILPDGISSRNKLDDLLDQIATSVQGAEDKIVNGSFNDIYDLYDAGIVTEPFKVILLHNALPDISEENLLKLYSYITGYHKYGVRFIIVDDFSSINSSRSSRSQGFSKTLDKILDSCTQVQFRENAPALIDGVETSMISTKDGFDRIKVYDYCKQYLDKEIRAPYVSYESIGFGKEQRDPNEYDEISIPVASTGTGVWSMGFASVSNGKSPMPLANLILGIPGTGKTKLIDALIYNASMKYSPDEIIFHLLDFKDGSMSQDYLMDINKVPHVKVISAKNSPEEAGFILDNIQEESTVREGQFDELSRILNIKIENIGSYNKQIDDNNLSLPKMPRLIIAVDECQTLFETDTLAQKAQDIIRKGRSRGIHFVLATQAMNSTMKKTINFVDGLYVFEGIQDDINVLFTDKSIQKRVNNEVPKGTYQAFASNDNGRTTTKIKIAFYGPPPAPANYAEAVRNKWSNYPCEILQIGENSKLNINTEKYQEILSDVDDFKPAIGEKYTNRKPFYLNIPKSNYSSTLLVGGMEQIASSINISIMLSARKSKIPMHIIDMSQEQMLARVKKECFASDPSVFVGTGKDYNSKLTELYGIYLSRVKERNENPGKKFEPVVFIVNGAHEISDYEMDTSFATATTKVQKAEPVQQQDLTTTSFASKRSQMKAQKQAPKQEEALPEKLKSKTSLIELMSKGKKLGIFVSLWIDKAETSIERKNLKDSCDTRIIFREIKSGIDGFLESTFKPKMIDNVNENMALVDYSNGTRALIKIRVYQYDLDDINLIDYIKTL